MTDTSNLNLVYAIKDHISFEKTANGLDILRINNQFADAKLYLQGAHLLSWCPKGHSDVIWLSDDAKFVVGKSIRGGIPVCWPWFGSHASDQTLPAHGFARTQLWDVTETRVMSNGNSFVALRLLVSELAVKSGFDQLDVELHISVGETLEMSLVTKNNSERLITFGQALHSYFRVSDIQNVIIKGLEEETFIDALEDWRQKSEADPIKIDAEIDRIYLQDKNKDCIIQDSGLKRSIRISKQGSHSTVVWNPWIDKSARLGDMGENGYKTMVCVESCNAADDVVVLSPAAEHRLSVCYKVEPFE